jgi:hypothetical protein
MNDERQRSQDEPGVKGKKTGTRIVELSQGKPQGTDTDENANP